MFLGQVYESLKKAEEMPREKLRMLDAPGSEHLIYEMRFLALEARPPAALYILDNNLSPAVPSPPSLPPSSLPLRFRGISHACWT